MSNPRKNGRYAVTYSRRKSREVRYGTATYTRGQGWTGVKGPYNRYVVAPTIHSWE